MFIKLDHVLGHTANLNTFKRKEFMQSLLSNHCGIKLKIINRKLLIPNVSLCWGMLIMGETDGACVGAGVCGKSLYLPPNFAVNLRPC